MYVWYALYFTLSTILALGAIAFVIIDVAWERTRKAPPAQKEAEPEEEEPVVTVSAPQVESMPPAVEQIDAVLADSMISNALAIQNAHFERGAGHGYLAIINIGQLDRAFAAHETVTLAAMKEKGLLPRRAGRVKILADGLVTKPLTVKAEAFSVQAVKMVELTGGTVIVLQD